MVALVRIAALTNFPEVAQALGYNPDAALRRVGLSLAMLAQRDRRIASDTVVELLERAAHDTGCETFGLRMAQSRKLSNFGIVSLLLTHQPTLRDILSTTTEYLHLLNESLALHLEDAGPLVVVHEEVMSSQPARQSVELAIGVLCRMCSALMGMNWRPVSVNFSHLPPADLSLHRQLFPCRIEFGSGFNGLVCRAADLDVPNPAADPELARYAKHLVEAASGPTSISVAQEVRKAIYLMLPLGRATCEQVAQGLGRGMRTLQRQLEDDGVSFSGLVDEVRRDLARRYLDNPRYRLGEIATLLGYTTHSAFTRWFQVEFGTSPTAWRTRLRVSRQRASAQ